MSAFPTSHQELIEENRSLRQRIRELENAESRWKLAEQAWQDSEARLKAFLENNPDIAWMTITEIKKMEERLEKGAQILKAIQAITKVGGWEWDVAEQTMTWTEEVYRIHDIDSTEVEPGSKKHVDRSLECYNDVDRSVIMEAFQRCIDNGEAYDMEFPFTSAKGRSLWIRTVAEPVLSDGRVVKVVGNILDITEGKRAEEELRARGDAMRAIFDATTEALCVIDVKGTFLMVNTTFANRFNKTSEDLIGTSIYDLIVPELAKTRAEQVDLVIKSLKPIQFEDKRVDRFIEHSLYPIFDSVGNVSRIAIYARDITDRKQAEKELRKTEEKFSALFRSAPIPMAISTIKGGYYLDVNDAFLKRLGFLRDEVVGRSSIDLGILTPGDREAMLRKMTAAGEVRDVEVDIRTKDGRILTGMFNAELIHVDEDQYWLTIFVDISERKTIETVLRESEERYRNIFENAIEGIYQSTPQGRYITVNPAFAKMAGYNTPEEMIKAVTDIAEQLYVHPEDREEIKRSLAATGFIQGYEAKIRRRDGTLAWVSINARAIRDSGGNIVYFEGTTEDISERKSAAIKLQEQYQFINTLLDSVPSPIFYKDTNGIYLGCNKAFAEFNGRSKEEIIGKSVYEVWEKDLADVYYQADLKLLQNPGVQIFETSLVHTDGTVHPIVFYKATFNNQDGTLGGLIGSFLDISERKQAESRRQELEERLKRAEKMEALGLLAGGVAHDLNNTLGILVGYAELLYDDLSESDPRREDARNIITGGEQSAAIVQDLLTLARRGVQTKAPANLNKLVSEYLKSPDYLKLTSFHPEIRINTELEDELLQVKGSKVHLSKTLINLVSNAAEAMPMGGEVIIRTENRYLDRPVSGYDELKEGDYVVLSVSDEGEGITDDDMKRIFEPFYTKKVMGRSGTGLGLSVVWGTVKDHEGYIDVRSLRGRGTTFYLYFPVTQDKEGEKESTIKADEYMGKGEKILIVDDIQTQRDLASRILSKLNYSVTTVSSGEEAIEYIRSNNADLVILDMIMDPGIDGFDTYRLITEFKPKQRAVIVSGFAETDRVRMTQSLGAGAFVKKPYIRERIGLAVRKELDRK